MLRNIKYLTLCHGLSWQPATKHFTATCSPLPFLPAPAGWGGETDKTPGLRQRQFSEHLMINSQSVLEQQAQNTKLMNSANFAKLPKQTKLPERRQERIQSHGNEKGRFLPPSKTLFIN